MTTRSITLELPASLAAALDPTNRELIAEIFQRGLQQWRIEKILERYMRGEMSFGAASERVGLPQSELARHAYVRGLEPPTSEETLLEEMA